MRTTNETRPGAAEANERDPPRGRRGQDDEDDERPTRSRRRDDDEDRPPRKPRGADPEDEIPDGTPRVYKHKNCGGKTTMPADIVVAYLDDPFQFDDHTYCARCEVDVPRRECIWTESGQSVEEYFEELHAKAFLSGRYDFTSKYGSVLVQPIAGAAIGAIGGGLLGYKFGRSGMAAILGVGIGIVLGAALGAFMTFREKGHEKVEAERYRRRVIKKYKKRFGSRGRAEEDE